MAVKLAGIVAVAIAAIAVISVARVNAIRPAELHARQTRVHSLVDVAMGVVGDFQRQAADGTITVEQAKQRAAATVRAMRYSGKEYFWINDAPAGSGDPIHMIMHAAKPELDGTVISNIKDPDGVYVFRRFVATVQAHGSGFVPYRWPRPGAAHPVPKLSYVALFRPWGWVIGTGIYIDDVDKIVAAKRNTALIQSGVAVLLLVGALVAVVLAIVRPIRRLTCMLRTLAAEAAAGDIGTRAACTTGRRPPGERFQDELGRMAEATEVLRERLAANRRLEEEHERLRAETETHKHEAAVSLAAEVDAVVAGVADRLDRAVTGMQQAADELGVTAAQLDTSVTGISQRVADATSAADAAVREAAGVTGTVSGLTEAARTIGGVTTLIRGVAEQTNLLALNASIEAARAGAVGRGFAVVAGEVKALAAQSSGATDDIAHEVTAIQATSQAAAGSIDRMGGLVGQLGLATRAVAAAVDGTGTGSTGTAPGGATAALVAGTAPGVGAQGELLTVREATTATGEVAQRIQVASAAVATEAQQLRTHFDDLVKRITAT